MYICLMWIILCCHLYVAFSKLPSQHLLLYRYSSMYNVTASNITIYCRMDILSTALKDSKEQIYITNYFLLFYHLCHVKEYMRYICTFSRQNAHETSWTEKQILSTAQTDMKYCAERILNMLLHILQKNTKYVAGKYEMVYRKILNMVQKKY